MERLRAPQDVQSEGFEVYGETHRSYTPDSETPHTEICFEMGVRRFDTRPPSVPVLELFRLFVLASTGEAEDLVVIPYEGGFLPDLYRAAVQVRTT